MIDKTIRWVINNPKKFTCVVVIMICVISMILGINHETQSLEIFLNRPLSEVKFGEMIIAIFIIGMWTS